MGKDRKDRKEEGRALTAGTDLDKYTHPHTLASGNARKATLISKKRVSAQRMLRKDMMGVEGQKSDTFPFRISHS